MASRPRICNGSVSSRSGVGTYIEMERAQPVGAGTITARYVVDYRQRRATKGTIFSRHRDAIVTVAFAVVAFSIFAQGLTMRSLLRKLKQLPDASA